MTNHSDESRRTTPERIDMFKTLDPLLSAMGREFRELSKKKPDGVLNKQKVTIVNRLLNDVLSVLEDEPSRPYLDMLDDVELPQNSDVVLVLSQYEASMESFRHRYYYQDKIDDVFGFPTWHTE